MTPSKQTPATSAVSGPLGFRLAVCAGGLAGVLCLVAFWEAADANPAQSGHRGRPQQSFEENTRLTARRAVHPPDLVGTMGEADPAAVERVPMAQIRDTLESMRARGHEESATFQSLLQRWTRMARSEAVEWAQQLPEGALRGSALRTVAIEWASVDPLAGGAWARSMADQAEQRELLICISDEAVRSDPVAALRLAVELPADADADEIIRRAAMEWASKDAAGTMDWAKTISDESLRHKVLAAEMAGQDMPCAGAALAGRSRWRSAS